MLEPIEARTLKSASSFAAISSTGTLNVAGTHKPDDITIRDPGGEVIVSRDGIAESFQKHDVRRIVVNSFNGNDSVWNCTGFPSTLNGAGGNDSLSGGFKPDELVGGSGDNEFYSGGAEGGEDVIDHPNDPRGSFQSYVESGQRSGFIEIADGFSDDLIVVPQEQLTYRLTPGNDSFDGDFNQDIVIDGGRGNDTLNVVGDQIDDTTDYADVTLEGGAGSDHFELGEGPVKAVIGGNGDDYVVDGQAISQPGSAGTLSLGAGFDTDDLSSWDSGGGQDIIQAAAGVEKVIASDMNPSTIIGNGLNNVIVASPDEPVTMMGMGGDDTLIGDDKNDSLDGGDGNDSINGGDGDDTLHGGNGNDTITGGLGHDQIFGDAGDDTLFANDNFTDILDGGTGSDVAQRDNGPSVFDSVKDIQSFI